MGINPKDLVNFNIRITPDDLLRLYGYYYANVEDTDDVTPGEAAEAFLSRELKRLYPDAPCMIGVDDDSSSNG